MRSVKTVAFQYEPDEAIVAILENFGAMVDHALWVWRRRGIEGRFKLIKTVYDEFKAVRIAYPLYAKRTLSACEVVLAG